MKTCNVKEQRAKDVVAEKKFVCTSKEHLKWAKNYLNRSFRRRLRQDLKRGKEDE